MKRTLCIVLAFILVLALAPAAFAEWDLSGMSFEELVALKDQINLALWNSSDWQEVTVPQGVWQVGADIPAGKWTIVCGGKNYTDIEIADSLKDNETKAAFPPKASAMIYNTSSIVYDEGDLKEWTVDLHDGEYVVISSADAVFMPYSGKPSLGFK